MLEYLPRMSIIKRKRAQTIMNKFLNFYAEDTELKNLSYKSAIFTTLCIPLLFILALIFGVLSPVLSVVLIVCVAAVYISAIVFGVKTLVEVDFKYSLPLFISSIAGPFYIATLILFNPSLTSALGLFLWLVVPIVAIVAATLKSYNDFKKDTEYYDHLNNDDTVELEPIDS